MKTQCDGEDVAWKTTTKHILLVPQELKLLRNGNAGRPRGIVKKTNTVLRCCKLLHKISNYSVQFFHCDTLKPILVLHKSKYF